MDLQRLPVTFTKSSVFTGTKFLFINSLTTMKQEYQNKTKQGQSAHDSHDAKPTNVKVYIANMKEE